MNIKEIKKKSWGQISPHVFPLFLITLITSSVTYVIFLGLLYSVLPVLLIVLITAPFTMSANIVYLNLINGVVPTVGDAFCGFKRFGHALWICLLQSLFTFLWTLVFILPGVVKGYSYAMAPFIMIEDQNTSALDAIRKSKKMMCGHEWELFALDISFIPWDLFALVTCGSACVWVIPYHNTARANFYQELKNKK